MHCGRCSSHASGGLIIMAWTFIRVFTDPRPCTKNNDKGYTPPSLLLQIHWVRPTIRHKNITTSFHHGRCTFNSDLSLDSNLASGLGNPRNGPGRTARLSILPILVSPTLWILAQASLIFMGTVTLATLFLWRIIVIARMLNGRFGSRRRRARIVRGFSG